MRHIDGRWFLYTPLVIFLIYFGITSMIDYYSLLDPVSKEVFISRLLSTTTVISCIWTLVLFINAISDEWDDQSTLLFLYFTPIVVFTLLVKLWMRIDNFFHKYFTINVK